MTVLILPIAMTITITHPAGRQIADDCQLFTRPVAVIITHLTGRWVMNFSCVFCSKEVNLVEYDAGDSGGVREGAGLACSLTEEEKIAMVSDLVELFQQVQLPLCRSLDGRV